MFFGGSSFFLVQARMTSPEDHVRLKNIILQHAEMVIVLFFLVCVFTFFLPRLLPMKNWPPLVFLFPTTTTRLLPTMTMRSSLKKSNSLVLLLLVMPAETNLSQAKKIASK